MSSHAAAHAQPGRPGDDVTDGAKEEEEEEPAAMETLTVGQALRAVALSPAGARPVDRADAAVVEAAEKSATGLGVVVPGGVADAAHKAAETNEHEEAAGEAVTLGDVLGDATKAMPGDRAATWVDAEKVAAAMGSSAGREGGGMGEVADAMAAAAQINETSTL
ncbi:hypothetical protein HU200_039006 [Digitaria exilis]|uniref:SMP domain-containing protein n=1 Tax=Digitaria exilis TaxID=1010633 RepID=A0A835EI24_9POAL|nr:hypothetical protein HU200_039006 [Digitaria exilis]CAB3450189.1 unnamed protein product [Digitaria exilis]